MKANNLILIKKVKQSKRSLYKVVCSSINNIFYHLQAYK